MIKKILSILFVSILGFVLIACNKTSDEVQLPVLNGQTIEQIRTTLNNLDAEFNFIEENNFDILEGTFIRYGNGLSAGMNVNLSDVTLEIYIATHKIILPDLVGQTEAQSLIALRKLTLNVNISYRETQEHEEGTFIEYGGTFEVGQELNKNNHVSIVIAKYPSEYKSPIFMSKYLSGVSYERAIEIYNSLNVEVDLSDYRIDFYLDGDVDVTNSFVIPSGTKLSGRNTLLIVHEDASEALVEKADLVTDQLTFIGRDYIQLVDHKNAKIDEFGLYGVYVMNFHNRLMVRNDQTDISNLEFDQREWDLYHHEHYSILDNHPTPFPTSFTFDPADLLITDFYTSRGMVEVTYDRSVDGDTSLFSPGFLGEERLRYIGVNTPERGEPHSESATQYLDSLLRNADTIYIQHHPYFGPRETYQRHLGFVWADGLLVNYEMVLKGWSANFYNDPENHFIFEGVTLNEWFRRAEASAKAQRLGIWS